ncbi:translation elongation factor Ts (EF-Ts) [Coriobacterium glomerans PW2]|uniref:Elongation factor Ts n=1 Tax=Coriobacterium glomerans (strain ATCC 49209 / DSM 20642 / JCM 10262 / PW2) TaxID=700015 RepID=F2N9G9_CORGP|nr:translation elongation factor Ts [Coriobacterium glomerans]AEB06998.1 translation elongation factor Ts (EF-Ts) [Coriobacterium glomerans PW2]
MANISAALVKQLREMTDSPMMECKKALVEAEGDLDSAIDILRRNGLAAAAKKAGRDTNEGAIGAYVSDDLKIGSLVEVACETDFVASNPRFTGFTTRLAEIVASEQPEDIDALLGCPYEGETVQDALTELIHVIGENMKISRLVLRRADAGALSSYVHMGGKIAVLVEFAFEHPSTSAAEPYLVFAHDVAMQVAAAAPTAAVREDVPADVIDHEISIYKAQAAQSGKPEAIQEKMATGRLEKYFKSFVLNEQEFIKDPGITIDAYAANVSEQVGDKISIVGFDRLERGGSEA